MYVCVCIVLAGGFFASGFKRAFKMKDFGQTIPGHGGVTDRFDCQMIMAMFAYVYYWNYVASTEHTVGEALDVSTWLLAAMRLLWTAHGCTGARLGHAVARVGSSKSMAPGEQLLVMHDSVLYM